mgnify:CR=1 FL=1
MHNGFLNLLPRNCGNHHGSRENSSVQRICSHGRIYSAGHYQRKLYAYADYNPHSGVPVSIIIFLVPRHPTEIPEGEIPDPAVIKQYRIDHPGASLQDALIALMTKSER